METQQSVGPTKNCPKCGELIQASAKRCKHCQSDLRSWFVRHKIITGIAGLFIAYILFLGFGGAKKEDMKASPSEGTQSNNNQATDAQAPVPTPQNKINFIKKSMGEEVQFKTLKIKVNSVSEKQSLSGILGGVKTPSQGAKFAVISMDVTNITQDTFNFSPDTYLRVADESGRKFKVYGDSIGSTKDYLDYKELSPSIVKKGTLVYELPQDMNTYDLFFGEDNSNDFYQIKLK